MAKQKNTTEVTGGLSALDGLNFDLPEETGEELPRPVAPANNRLAAGYRKRPKVETKVRTNIMLMPSTKKRLEKAVENGEIESASSLIQYLLDEYFKGR